MYIVQFMVVFFMFVLCSGCEKERRSDAVAYDYCEMKSMEYKISKSDKPRYQGLCMSNEGYIVDLSKPVSRECFSTDEIPPMKCFTK